MVATVVRLSAAASTVHYFEADGYYARGDPEHRKASAWHGQAAAALGLRGPVKPRRFEAVLAGYVPGTRLRLGRLRDGEHQHRPGVDVTFSAPKSVSLEALVYAPGANRGARVVRAHDEAVRATLDFIEAELLQTRDYDRSTGRRPRVQANGLVAATFRHVASRNLDPQLHTHAVVANMTRNREGRWRSAEFTAVERSTLLIGAFYRNELRIRLEAMGYATVSTLVGRECRGSRLRATRARCSMRSHPAPGAAGLHAQPALGVHAGPRPAGGAPTPEGARPSRTAGCSPPPGRSARASTGRRAAATSARAHRRRVPDAESPIRLPLSRWCAARWTTSRSAARCSRPTSCAHSRSRSQAGGTRSMPSTMPSLGCTATGTSSWRPHAGPTAPS